MARFPDDQLHGFLPIHGNGFDPLVERARSAGGVVTAGLAFAYALYEEVLKVAAGIGDTPGNGAVMAQNENGPPRNRGARQAEARRFQACEIPESRCCQRQMGVAGQ